MNYLESFGARFGFTLEWAESRTNVARARESLLCDMYADNMKMQEVALDIQKELGKDIFEKITFVRERLKKYFSDRGVEADYILPPVYLVPQTSENQGIPATQKDYHIEINNQPIADQGLKQLQFLKNLAHELYHGAAKIIRIMKYNDQGVVYATALDRQGMTYFHDRTDDTKSGDGHGSAIEEGGAVQAESIVFAEVKKLFPQETVEMYDKIISAKVAQRKKDNPSEDINPEFISYNFLDESGYINAGYNVRYLECLKLNDFLQQQIPDFEHLRERVRVGDGNSLLLARAIEQKFGKGYYRKIVQTPNTQAKDLLIELQNKIHCMPEVMVTGVLPR